MQVFIGSILIIGTLTLTAAGYVWWYSTPSPDQAPLPITDIAVTEPITTAESNDTTMAFADTPMIIGTTPVMASVADSQAERVAGLSGVPSLEPNEVKLFIFDYDEQWSFWMKDMLFSIDMIWVDASSTIVYIAEDVTPESFPKSFKPTKPARYVIETVAGFANEHNIGVGDRVTLPEGR